MLLTEDAIKDYLNESKSNLLVNMVNSTLNEAAVNLAILHDFRKKQGLADSMVSHYKNSTTSGAKVGLGTCYWVLLALLLFNNSQRDLADYRGGIPGLDLLLDPLWMQVKMVALLSISITLGGITGFACGFFKRSYTYSHSKKIAKLDLLEARILQSVMDSSVSELKRVGLLK